MNLIRTKPVGYLEFLNLMENCKLILTDSGGIQEEASFLKVPVITLRKNTERPVTVEKGTNTLVDCNYEMAIKNIDKILDPNFDHQIWKEVSEICIGCGTCSFLCPTCTCFDVIDENDPNENRGRRVRIWDTCQSCLYTLHTSGHNPRNSCIQRVRNRILHKFCYYPENYDMLGCVGCGRCIQLCPANNDLRVIIQNIKKIVQKKEEKISA